MKYCVFCAEELPDDANFCSLCGRPQQAAELPAEIPAGYDTAVSGTTARKPAIQDAKDADIVSAIVSEINNLLTALVSGGLCKKNLERISGKDNALYRLSFNYRETGPYPRSRVIELYQTGELSPRYWICEQGISNWMPLNDMLTIWWVSLMAELKLLMY